MLHDRAAFVAMNRTGLPILIGTGRIAATFVDCEFIFSRNARSTQSLRFRSMVLRVLVAAAAVALVPPSLHAQIAVIVNTRNLADELSLDQLRRLFLGQSSTFPSGGRVLPVEHATSAPAFDRSALGLQPQAVRSRWMAIAFRGESTALLSTFASIDELKAFVRDHPDAIAYLPVGAVDKSVKVLRIDGLRPNDPSYPIH
jgi:hypothetical protein